MSRSEKSVGRFVAVAVIHPESPNRTGLTGIGQDDEYAHH
jgi:hypothetical protein